MYLMLPILWRPSNLFLKIKFEDYIKPFILFQCQQYNVTRQSKNNTLAVGQLLSEHNPGFLG